MRPRYIPPVYSRRQDSDEEDETEGGAGGSRRETSAARSHGASPHEAAGSNPFRERVRRTIRKRVGHPDVPPIPPSRHLRILEASKRARSGNSTAAREQSEISGAGSSGTPTVSAALAAAGGGSGAPAGLGVAGLFLGLRKGMVDKAAQEVGKKLALWPGGIPSVGSFGSLAAGTVGQNSNQLQTPVESPRSTTTAGFSTALTDSPGRWGSSSHGSTASTESGVGGGDVAPAFPGVSSSSSLSPLQHAAAATSAATAAAADARLAATGGVGGISSPLSVGGSGLPRVSSLSSRTALIRLSDLELAEPCGSRVATATSGASRRSSFADSGGGGGATGGGAVTGEGQREGTPTSKPPRSALLPPRPADEYELLFESKVIGLKFSELADGRGVFVKGRNGYVGPTPTGFPGERLCPEIGDILESYNGVSAHGKSADVVAGELAKCGRPLRLGFRCSVGSGLTESIEEEEEQEQSWSFGISRAQLDGSGDGMSLLSKVKQYSWGAQSEGGGGGSCRDAVASAKPSPTRAVLS